ncbi:MAG: family 78 glycoside hydrolase catalytic domain [Bacteroidales bacterium]|nr:family 78 glycoside hydrolase catalytic domain [Bacteroidales bacterium]
MKKIVIIICLLTALLPVMAQEFIGCRIDSGWAETPIFLKRIGLSDTDFYNDRVFFDLKVASLGYCEVYVNGYYVPDGALHPAVSQLNKRALEVTYDITRFLKKGDNVIQLWIGQGWGRVYGTPAAVRAVMTKTVSDGECGEVWTFLQTDSTWEASPTGYSYTGSWQPMQFGGEKYDSRVEPDWRPASIYEAKGITISQQEFKGNRIIDDIAPVSETVQLDGSILLDFGRVITGTLYAIFNPAPEEGEEITMEYLDHLEAKPPFTEKDIFIADGSANEHFQNRFHLHSFRYVRVRGAGDYEKHFTAYQISAVHPEEGATFECSDPRLNAIHDLVKYTLSCLTFSGYMVDCPHIERMGYGGDGNSSTMTLQTIWDVRDTYRNWMLAWSDAMDSTGDLPYVAPAFRTGGGPYWSGFIIKAPYRTYLNYGDRSLIDRHYNEMCRWLDFVEKHCDDGILKPWPDTERHSWFLGDWAVPEGVDKGGESVLHVSNCFLAECLSDMVQMARLTGHTKDAKRYAEWRERLVRDIHRHFYHSETHTYANGTPLDQCYALLQGIPPDSVTIQAVKEQLLKDCHGKYRDHIAGGLMGVPIFTEWCIRERQADLMATILRQPDYPGYLNMMDKECVNALMRQCVSGDTEECVNALMRQCVSGDTEECVNALMRQCVSGDMEECVNALVRQCVSSDAEATNTLTQSHNNAFTTWESWDCGRPDKEDRSRVHNCYNGIGIWFYQALAGIRPDPNNPGYRHFFVDPQSVDGVNWLRATKPTAFGDICVEIDNNVLKLTVPQGASATVFPSTRNEQTVSSGTWLFEINDNTK